MTVDGLRRYLDAATVMPARYTNVGRQTVCNLLSFSLPRFTFSKMSLADLVHM